MRRVIITSLLAVAMLSLSIALAQNPPAADDEAIITKMRVQYYKAVQYFYD